MSAQQWTVLDVEQGTYLPGNQTLQVQGNDLQVHKQTRQGGLSDGVDVLEVVNGNFRFRVVPTRGMGLWDAHVGEDRIGWQSPVRGPVHPQYVDLGEPSGLGWLDGFDEMLVRCGLESNGAPEFNQEGRLAYPLHGRIANRPAHRVQVAIEPDQVTVVGQVEETRFHFLKLRLTTTITTQRGRQGLQIRDEIQNLSQSPAEAQLLYHVNFGQPLLDAGAHLAAPVQTLVPRNERAAEGLRSWNSFSAEQPGYEEQVYFAELRADEEGWTQVLLKDAHGRRGASLRFNKRQLPCFTLWKNTTALADGYVAGLEPGTNYPNPRSYEGQQGRLISLPPGGRSTILVELDFPTDSQAVQQAEEAVRRLQGSTPPQIFDAPQPGWCHPL